MNLSFMLLLVSGVCLIATTVVDPAKFSEYSAGVKILVSAVWLGMFVTGLVLIWLPKKTGASEEAATKESSQKQFGGTSSSDIAKIDAISAQMNALQKKLGPRVISEDIFSRKIYGMTKSRVKIVYLKDNNDCYSFALQAQIALEKAGWSSTGIHPLDSAPNNPLIFSDSPEVEGARRWGISVTAGPHEQMNENGAARVLASALSESVNVNDGVQIGSNPAIPMGLVYLIIAPRGQ